MSRYRNIQVRTCVTNSLVLIGQKKEIPLTSANRLQVKLSAYLPILERQAFEFRVDKMSGRGSPLKPRTTTAIQRIIPPVTVQRVHPRAQTPWRNSRPSISRMSRRRIKTTCNPRSKKPMARRGLERRTVQLVVERWRARTRSLRTREK